MLRERLRIFSVCAARDGISDSVRSPCAIVLPPGNSRRGALDVDMNPVVVAGEAGEAVDLRLVDGDPVARWFRASGRRKAACRRVYRLQSSRVTAPRAS